jgi:CRISPR-associated protein Csx17
MSITIHHLYGCTPTPLANYLKALGILRLVSEQADPSARGAWRDEHFVLATKLTESELETFFLERYAPTPILGPWAARAGFFKVEKAKCAMDKILLSDNKRFDGLKEGISACRRLLEQHHVTEKAQDDEKIDLLFWCRRELPRTMMQWLDACYVLRADMADARRCFPPIMGTGANEGSGSYVSNFIQAIEMTLLDRLCDQHLLRSLIKQPNTGISKSVSLGQFVPDSDDQGNPWDLLLCLEGIPLLSSSITRISQQGFDRTDTASPFSTRGASAGHQSSGDDEMRGEQWFPLWDRWASLTDVRCLFLTGRAQVKSRNAHTSVDFARSIARTGVTHGVTAFERYGYYNRNNIKYYFAVPLGRWKVTTQPNQELLADIDAWLNRFQKAAREKGAPNRLAMLNKRLTDAVMAVTSQGSDPLRWQDILLALAEIEACMASGSGISAGILSSLRPGWLKAADDRSPEIRLALALAAQYGIRNHWLPLDPYGKRLATTDEGKRLAKDPRVVCFGRDLVSDALALVNRRIVEAAQDGGGNLNMTPVNGALTADLRDIASFLQGGLNHGKIMRLARAFMMLDLSALREAPRCLQPPALSGAPVDDAFTMIRFCLLPKHCVTGREWKIPLKAEIYRRLSSGDQPTAMRLAVQHLRAHGFVPPLQIAAGDPRLLAASMAFSLSCSSRDELLQSFITTPTNQGE